MIIPTMLALAAATTPLQPVSKWTVDYGTNMCTAARTFGSEASPTTFALQLTDYDINHAELAVLAPADGKDGSKGGVATLTLSPSGQTVKVDYMVWSVSGKVRGYKFRLKPDVMAQLGVSNGLALDAGGTPLSFATGGLQPLLTALNMCNTGLLQGWGIDSGTVAEPVGDPGKWITDLDYPSSAKQRGAKGKVTVVMTVTPEGRVSECRVVATSRDADLDKASCELLRRRARFVAQTSGAANRYSVQTATWFIGA